MRTTGGPPWGLPRSFWKTGNMSLHDVRRDYSGDVLPQDLTSFDPWEFFTSWLETAIAADEVEPNAMLLATIGSDGRPRSRVVLLKETSCNGLVFFTHYISPKGEQLAANPVASATFWWPQLMRQVRAVGAVTKLTRQENETYFAKRPRNSQLGAWASRQSAPIVSRDDLLETWVMVRGGVADLTDGLSSRMRGLRRHSVGWEGLLPAADLGLCGPGVVAEAPSIEELLVHLAKECKDA